MSKRALTKVVRSTFSAPHRAFASEVPHIPVNPPKPQSVPNLGVSNASAELDEIPVEMMSYQQRLTRTPEDRALLRKTLTRMAQLLVFSIVVNGAHLYGAFDPVLEYFNASEPARPALEDEDQAIVDRIGLLTLPAMTDRMAAAPRHIPRAAPVSAAGSAGEPSTKTHA